MFEGISAFKKEWFIKQVDRIVEGGVSKSEISEKLGVKPQYLNSIINGDRGVGDSFLDKFMTSFDINLFDLFSREPESKKTSNTIPENKSGRVIDIARIPVVEIEAAAGGGAFNSDHINEIDTIELPYSMVRKNTQYLCLRIRGRSMEPTLQHDGYVIARMLEPSEWIDVKDGYIYVVSSKEGVTWIKRLKNRLTEKGFMICTSDNPDKSAYANFNILESELNTIWYVEWYLSARMPNIHESYYHRQSVLEEAVESLKYDVNSVMRSLNMPNTR